MSKKSRSKLWFLVHSWLTLPVWFFVLIVCVTGTLAVVSQEIVWLATPEARASQPSDDAPLLTYEQVLTAIHKSEPALAVQVGFFQFGVVRRLHADWRQACQFAGREEHAVAVPGAQAGAGKPVHFGVGALCSTSSR